MHVAVQYVVNIALQTGGFVNAWCVFVDDTARAGSRVCGNAAYACVRVCVLAPVVCSSCKEIASSHNRSIREYFQNPCFCLRFNQTTRVCACECEEKNTRTDNRACVLAVSLNLAAVIGILADTEEP